LRIVRYARGNRTGIGIEEGGGIVPLDFEGDMVSLIQNHPEAGGIADLAVDGEIGASDVRMLAPIRRPGKIVCLGRNYAAHAAESGMSVPEEPIIFPKASSSVIGPGEAIVHHRICTRVDHEVELAVIIGSCATRTSREDALDKVFGYTIINDVSARDMQKKDLDLKNPWFRSKSLDTFCPMGPCIVTRDEIADPQALSLECRVNSKTRQKGNTRDMIFPVDRLIEFISLHMTLEPGDIISTGTPEGISAIVPGDLVECEVEGVGLLSNPVVADSP
jgi:2-keto-4-pentenoate hydratase/2-oxohepta-3-ene-1,7-dioic acid hydratase in catechol pathway